MARIGTIIQTHGSLATVHTGRRGICEGCSQEADCCGPGDPGQERLQVRNTIGAQPGDRVEFDLPGHGEMTLAFVVWAIPLAGLVAGAVLGSRWGGSALSPDTAGLLAGLAGFLLGLGPAIVMDRRSRRTGRFLPEVLRVLPGPCPAPAADEAATSSIVNADESTP